MEQTRSKTPIIFFLAVLILSIVAVFLLVTKCSSESPDVGNTANGETLGDENAADNITLTPGGKHVDDIDLRSASTAEELVSKISQVAIRTNDTGDVQPLIDLLGQRSLTVEQIAQLKKLAAASRLKFNPNTPFSSVGGDDNRWSLNLVNRNRILLDLKKTEDGKWHVNRITLPDGKKSTTSGVYDPANPDDEAKAAATVQGFLTAITQLDPATARQHIDTTKVSYARLAGLCIIFEEGKYKLIQERALRKMFLRDTSAGWLARVESPGTGEAAMFAINTKRKDAESPWKITEINLDKLLADYANNVSGGDIHYTPLIRNPKGGDSLVIYFDLNSNELTSRTQRQLSIVANLLKTNTEKKLTISGHTDALGSEDYNLALSQKRAQQVMAFLAEKGVAANQMNIEGYGKAKPRLPNKTKDGQDAPDGRRANRRAEIFLDF